MATEQERNRGMGAYSSPGVDKPFAPAPFVPLSTPPTFTFGQQNLQPPSNLYITTSDHIRLDIQNSLAGVEVDVHYRILEVDGQIHQGLLPFFPTSDRSNNNFFFSLAEGFLLSLSLGASPVSTKRGQTFAALRLVSGSPGNDLTRGVLLMGYLSGRTNLVWPISPPAYTPEGTGFIRSIVGTTPAAGADISETVPTGARWLLRSLQATLTTSATVATRRATLILDDGVSTFHQVTWNQSQAATLAQSYGVGLGAQLVGDPLTLVLVTPTPNVILAAGFRIRTGTSSIQVGDQWGAPRYEVEEWVEL